MTEFWAQLRWMLIGWEQIEYWVLYTMAVGCIAIGGVLMWMALYALQSDFAENGRQIP